MKKIKQLGKIAFLALALSFASCSSDSAGGSTGGAAGEGTITAKVDGKSFKSLSAATIGQVSDQVLQVIGSNAKGENISIQILSFNGIGTYDVKSDGDTFAVCSYTAIDLNDPQNTNNIYSSGYDGAVSVGSVDVTSVTDTNIKGTFSFTAKNQAGASKSITAGSFNVKKQ